MKADMRLRIGSRVLRYATPLLFVALFLFFGLQEPRFFGAESVLNIIKQASFVAIAAVGMTFVLLTAGIDLSVGSVMYLAPLVAGFSMRTFGIGPVLGLLIALLVGAILGAINAFCIVRLRIVPFIVTLATLFFFRGAGTFMTQSRQLDFPRSIVDFGLTNVLGLPLPIVVLAVVVLIAYVVLSQTVFGRQVYAIGNDPEAAKKAGIKSGRVLTGVYIISGACAALAGYMLMSQIGRLDQGFGEGKEFDVIAAAVLGGASLFGGIGTAFGAMIGALLIQTVNAGLVFIGLNLYIQPMVQGALIFLAVFLDSLRQGNLAALKRRFIRSEA